MLKSYKKQFFTQLRTVIYVIFKIFPYRKEVITNNIKHSFPELNNNEIDALRSKFYKHFCDILIEGVKNISLSEIELKKRFLRGGERIQNFQNEEKGETKLYGGTNSLKQYITPHLYW